MSCQSFVKLPLIAWAKQYANVSVNERVHTELPPCFDKPCVRDVTRWPAAGAGARLQGKKRKKLDRVDPVKGFLHKGKKQQRGEAGEELTEMEKKVLQKKPKKAQQGSTFVAKKNVRRNKGRSR